MIKTKITARKDRNCYFVTVQTNRVTVAFPVEEKSVGTTVEILSEFETENEFYTHLLYLRVFTLHQKELAKIAMCASPGLLEEKTERLFAYQQVLGILEENTFSAEACICLIKDDDPISTLIAAAGAKYNLSDFFGDLIENTHDGSETFQTTFQFYLRGEIDDGTALLEYSGKDAKHQKDIDRRFAEITESLNECRSALKDVLRVDLFTTVIYDPDISDKKMVGNISFVTKSELKKESYQQVLQWIDKQKSGGYLQDSHLKISLPEGSLGLHIGNLIPIDVNTETRRVPKNT